MRETARNTPDNRLSGVQAFRRNAHVAVFLGAAALAAALGAVVAAALYTNPREANALRVPGTIVGVTVGSAPLVLGATWQKCLLGAFPRLQTHIGGAVLRPGTNVRADSLIVWKNLGPVSGWSGPPPIIDLRLSGDHDNRMEVLGWGSMAWHQLGRMTVETFEIPTFPRRGERVTLHFLPDGYDHHPQNQPDFTVRTPPHARFPVWAPKTSREMTLDGRTKVALERFETVTPPGGGTRLRLRIRENGRPSDNWAVERVSISDPTGNRWDTFGYGPSSAGAIDIDNGSLLLPNEPAYRIRLEMARTGRFPPNEVWTVPDLPEPAPREIVRINRRREMWDGTVTLAELYGPDNGGRWAVGRIWGTRLRSRLRAISPSGGPYHLILPPDTRGGFLVHVPVAKGGGTSRLKLALTPLRTVEFLAHASR